MYNYLSYSQLLRRLAMLLYIILVLSGFYAGFGLCYNAFLASRNDTFMDQVHPDEKYLQYFAIALSTLFWPYQMLDRRVSRGSFFTY